MRTVKTRHREAGQAVVMTVLLSLVVLLGFMGLAIDVGMLFRDAKFAQTAADAAAIAGAAELVHAATDAVTVATAAEDSAADNGFTSCTVGSVTPSSPATCAILVNNPPVYGPHAGSMNYVEVIVAHQPPTLFFGLFHPSAAEVRARAVAMSTNSCSVYGLGPTGFNGSQDFEMDTTASFVAKGCGIYSNSTIALSQECYASPSQCNSTITAGSVGEAGSQNGSDNVGNKNVISPSPVQGMATPSDPLANSLTAPSAGSCSGSYTVTKSSTTVASGYCNVTVNAGLTGVTIPSGTYNNITINSSASSVSNVTFGSGTYYLTGTQQTGIYNGLTIGDSATVNGSGVTFYLNGTSSTGASVNVGYNVGDNATSLLSAPTSGAYNDILFFQNPNNAVGTVTFGCDSPNTSQSTCSGNQGDNLNLTGIIYLPGGSKTNSGNLTFNLGHNPKTPGSTPADCFNPTLQVSLIAQAITVNGIPGSSGCTMTVTPPPGSGSLLSTATLVE